MPYKRKKYHHGDTHLKKRWRLRNRKKDLDEIDQDLKEENAEKLLNQEADLDVPGAAQHYCLHCARYFIDEQALNEHFKTKVHKRRLKALELEPYSIEESERAAGHGNFKLPNKRKITSQTADKKENLDNDGDVILDNVPARNSALFVNGPKTQEIFRYVTPQVDYDDIVKKKQTLIEQIGRRKLDFDFKKLENLWDVYLELKQRKMEMDNKRLEIIKEIGKLIESKAEDKHKNKLIMQSNFLKENIYKLKIPLWSAEESAMLEALSLPNILHADTPDGENKVIFTHLTPPSVNKDHLEIGRKLKILEFTKNENYYFKGDAALFELGSKFYFNRTLRCSKFIQLSNPDFVKSVVIEGCGGDHTNPDSTFILHHNEDSKINVDNRLHLVGGGSLYSFFAYHCKNVIYKKVLPLKYFTMGRQYIPAPVEEDSLFHVSQSSVVQFFGVAANQEESEKLMEEVIEILKEAYRPFGYHFRLSYLSADKLFLWESLRVRLEMFSTSLGKYVEIANVSMSGDFISKRLMFVYKERENKEKRFTYIISGTFLNVPRFLACVLEQESNFSLPEEFKTNNWKI